MRYTSSPLGIFDSNYIPPYAAENIGNRESEGYSTMFSSFRDKKGNKHILMLTDGIQPGLSSNLTKTPHSNEIYDVSTLNIIEKLNGFDHLRVKYSDFAYLSKLGVYPNNRLVIVRRFPNPVESDLYSLSSTDGPGFPLSTMIGWADEQNWIPSITFGETWAQADATFKEILNEIGNDFQMGFMNPAGGLGSYLGQGGNAVTLGGFTHLLQRRIMVELGIIKKDENENSVLPAGDPNLIKDGQVRQIIKDDIAGSPLKGKFSYTLKTRYEQKFINGVDPTTVFMDILNNALQMGTSVSTFYLGRNKDAYNGMKNLLKDLQKDPITKITEILKSVIESIKKEMDRIKGELEGSETTTESENDASEEDVVEEESNKIGEIFNKSIDFLDNIADDIIRFVVLKYRIRIIGVIAALTGSATGPWHITIGNPLKPIFCSGDMICNDVKITFGPVLGFNDLPTFMDIEVQLTSARDLGLQEIFSRFNSGEVRTKSNENGKGGYLIVGEGVNSFWSNKWSDFAWNPTASKSNLAEPVEENVQGLINYRSNKPADRDQEGPIVTKVSEKVEGLIDQGKKINSDVYSPTSLVEAATKLGSEVIKTDATQEATGNTEGSPSQIINEEVSQNSGVDAKPIENTIVPTITNIELKSEDFNVLETVPKLYVSNSVYVINGQSFESRGFGSSEKEASLRSKNEAIKKYRAAEIKDGSN